MAINHVAPWWNGLTVDEMTMTVVVGPRNPGNSEGLFYGSDLKGKPIGWDKRRIFDTTVPGNKAYAYFRQFFNYDDVLDEPVYQEPGYDLDGGTTYYIPVASNYVAVPAGYIFRYASVKFGRDSVVIQQKALEKRLAEQAQQQAAQQAQNQLAQQSQPQGGGGAGLPPGPGGFGPVQAQQRKAVELTVSEDGVTIWTATSPQASAQASDANPHAGQSIINPGAWEQYGGGETPTGLGLPKAILSYQPDGTVQPAVEEYQSVMAAAMRGDPGAIKALRSIGITNIPAAPGGIGGLFGF